MAVDILAALTLSLRSRRLTRMPDGPIKQSKSITVGIPGAEDVESKRVTD